MRAFTNIYQKPKGHVAPNSDNENHVGIRPTQSKNKLVQNPEGYVLNHNKNNDTSRSPGYGRNFTGVNLGSPKNNANGNLSNFSEYNGTSGAIGKMNATGTPDGNFVSSAKMTNEQCQLLEQYEIELKSLREDNLRLKKVEEEKSKLELDIEQIQGVHMQMDTIIGD
jgi:hypothetical protein